jgi:serine phosphatase RsbU (regulator of sigma subunit)
MKPRILLVDDDPLLLAGLKRQLRRHFHILTAAGGIEALQMVEAQDDPLMVVVSDYRMPGMNGIDLLAQIKALRPDMVRMMLTGSTDLKTAIQAVNEGHIFQFHLKPCPADALARAIDEGVVHYRKVSARTSQIKAMEKSMAQASEVQRNLVPKDHLTTEGLEIAGQSQWCDETGGDYYDFFSRRVSGKPHTGIVIGDVTGHGISSALLMTTARAFLRERITAPGSTAAIMTDVNRHLARDVDGTNRFMSMFYCEIDERRRNIFWTRAGHDPALIYTPGSDTIDELAGPGFPLPLGVMETAVYEESRREVQPGQVIVISTDGIWEARNPQGEYFGKNRLMTLVREQADNSATEMARSIIETLDTFRHPQPSEDDATLVVIKITS